MNRAKKDAPPRFPEFREAFLELMGDMTLECGAKYFLEKLIWGEMVTVQYSGRDKNGVILGLVLYGGTFVNYEMVKEGWA